MTTITILCGGGSRGDTQPYVALGKGLHAEGYHIRIVSDNDFEDMIIGHGLEFVSTGNTTRAFVEEHVAGLIHETNPIKAMRRFQKVLPLLNASENRQAAAQWQACQGSSAIIGHFLHDPFGVSVSQALDVPYFEAEVKPMIPTRAYAPSALPLATMGGALNWLANGYVEQSFWNAQRATLNKWRTSLMSLPALPLVGYASTLQQGLRLRLCGISQHILPRPADWGDHVHLTGCWTLHEAGNYQPPADLVKFLDAGSPPMCIGFGSMPSADAQVATAQVVKALALADQRGVLIGGWGGLAKVELPSSIFHIDSVPHDWLFPRIAAVVHHGGAGTTAAGLQAGVPSIIVPHLGDQAFWGRRVDALGVGPKPIPRRNLTPERLATAINSATTDHAMRDRAARLGERLRTENGVASAVEVIQRFI